MSSWSLLILFNSINEDILRLSSAFFMASFFSGDEPMGLKDIGPLFNWFIDFLGFGMSLIDGDWQSKAFDCLFCLCRE